MRLRSAVFAVHLTTGCLAGAVIFFLAATGFLLAWQKPIVAWQERGYYSAPPRNQAATVTLDRLIRNAEAEEGKEPANVTVDSRLSAPVEVEFGDGQVMFLNRYTGAVLGRGAARTRAFFDAVTALHRWFGTPLSDHGAARLVKGAFTFALLLMLVTGIWLWTPKAWTWPRVKAGLMLRFGLVGRARDWNRHSVVGFWVALPLAIIALTGTILAFGWMTHLLYVATGSPEPAKVQRTKAQAHHAHRRAHGADSTGVSLQQIFDETSLQAAGWHQIRITLPHSAQHTIEALIDFGNGDRPDQQERMAYNRKSGRVVALTTFSSLSLGQKIRSFVKYIHTGEAGGLAGETAAGFTALACCILIWTGLAMALRRLRILRLASRRTAEIAGTVIEPVARFPSD